MEEGNSRKQAQQNPRPGKKIAVSPEPLPGQQQPFTGELIRGWRSAVLAQTFWLGASETDCVYDESRLDGEMLLQHPAGHVPQNAPVSVKRHVHLALEQGHHAEALSGAGLKNTRRYVRNGGEVLSNSHVKAKRTGSDRSGSEVQHQQH